MRNTFFVCLLALTCTCTTARETTYTGSTLTHRAVRDFLGISLTDSVDFIRWTLIIRDNKYVLNCQYGIGKAGTNGFINEKRVELTGALSIKGFCYTLLYGKKALSILAINANLLHLLDENNHMLVGNGGFSYTLNRKDPVQTDQFNLKVAQVPVKDSMLFEGRTPCQPLSSIAGIERSPACDKIKWYILLYTDSHSSETGYYLEGPIGYGRARMHKGKWQIIHGKDDRLIYKLEPDKEAYAYYLLKADDNILLFTDPQGHLLVGNENFSYTLNRQSEARMASR